jgi:hypothetical protein
MSRKNKDFSEIETSFSGGMHGMLEGTVQPQIETSVRNPADRIQAPSKDKPKWESFTKVNALIGSEQKDFLDSLTKKVMRSRKGGEERITSNSILRCLVCVLEDRVEKLDLSGVSSEEDLRERLSKL